MSFDQFAHSDCTNTKAFNLSVCDVPAKRLFFEIAGVCSLVAGGREDEPFDLNAEKTIAYGKDSGK